MDQRPKLLLFPITVDHRCVQLGWYHFPPIRQRRAIHAEGTEKKNEYLGKI